MFSQPEPLAFSKKFNIASGNAAVSTMEGNVTMKLPRCQDYMTITQELAEGGL
jgi:hypothetical protein